MDEIPAIACTLTAFELRDRRAAWMKVGRYATASTLITGGIDFVFSAAPGVDESLAQLVDLERDCCAWMTIDLTRSGDSVVMSVTGSGADGETAARETFAPLVELVSARSSPARP